MFHRFSIFSLYYGVAADDYCLSYHESVIRSPVNSTPNDNVVMGGGSEGNEVAARLGARYTSTTSSACCGTAGAAGGIATRWHSVHTIGSEFSVRIGSGVSVHLDSSSHTGSGKGSQTGSHSGVPDGCSCRISVADLDPRRTSKAFRCASLRCSAVISMFANFSAYVRVGFNGVDMIQSSLVNFFLSIHLFQFFYLKLNIKKLSLSIRQIKNRVSPYFLFLIF